MKILDSHIHIFNATIIDNVISRRELVRRLFLQEEGVFSRLDTGSLLDDMKDANVQAALLLPTSDVENLLKTNRNCIQLANDIPELFTAGTLHPDYDTITQELSFLNRSGVRVIKFCSFSQGFALDHSNTRQMFQEIQTFNQNSEEPFSVVLDTLTLADQYFGTDPRYTTTPRALSDLAVRFPDINFIGAHMGGLGAPFEELRQDLKPLPNLYLDTSNASHTLSPDQFVTMLHTHGPGHIIFGTDWPWFVLKGEIELVQEYMERAGFKEHEMEQVFSGNLEKILGVTNKR